MIGIFKRVYTAPALVGCVLIFAASSAAQEKLDPAATRDYAVAYGLQSKQLYPQAAKRWQKFLDAYAKDPRRPNAVLYLGACQLQLKQFPQAIQSFRTVLDKYPQFKNRDVAQFNLALTHYNVGLDKKDAQNFVTAVAEFEKVVKQYSKSKYAPFARYYQGESQFAAGDLKAAVVAYSKFAQEFPNSSLLGDVLYALGTTQQELKDYVGAQTTFESFTKKFKESDRYNECRLRLGQSLVAQKQYKPAEKLFAAISNEKDFPFADYAMMQHAECRYAQNKFDDAARMYEKVANQFPKSKYRSNAWLMAGKAWFEAENYNQSRSSLSQIAALDVPDAPEAAYWLGQALLELKQPDEALRQMDQALGKFSKSPMRPKLQLTRAQALFDINGKQKEAVQQFAQFAQQNPKNELAAKSLYMAALGAMKLGDYEAAQQYGLAFLQRQDWANHELTPDALVVVGETYLHGDKADPKKAQPYFEKLMQKHPNHNQAGLAKLRLGLCHYLNENHPQSIAVLKGAAANLKTGELKAEAYLLLGRNYADMDKTAEARTALLQALNAKNNWERADEVLLPLAMALRKENNTNDAIKYLQQLTQRFPKSKLRAQALYHLGDLWTFKKDYNQARSFFEQASQFTKTELAPLAQYRIGANWFAQEKFTESVQTLSKLLSTNPNSKLADKSLYLRGLAYQQLKQFQPAVKDLTAFLAKSKDATRSAQARYALGLSYVGMKQFNEAATALAELLKTSPKFPHADSAQYEMAFALLAIKKTKEARAAFRELATNFPKSALAGESWFRVGEMYEGDDDFDQAGKAYASGLTVAADAKMKVKLQYKLGWILYQQKKLKEAGSAFTELVKVHPNDALALDASYLAGECFFRQNSFKEALAFYAKTLQKNDKKYQDRALYRSGHCAANLGQWPQSESFYKKLVDGFPKFDLVNEARYGLAFALQNQTKFKEAIPIYEQITKLTNTETAAKSRFMIGEIALEQKKYKEAIEHFLEVGLGYPYKKWQADSYLEAARCYRELEDKKNAREYLQTVLTKFGDQPAAKLAKKILDDLDK